MVSCFAAFLVLAKLDKKFYDTQNYPIFDEFESIDRKLEIERNGEGPEKNDFKGLRILVTVLNLVYEIVYFYFAPFVI